MGSIFSSSRQEEAESQIVAIHTKENWSSHWEASKNANKLLVIDFSASWCGPCRFIEPAFKSMAAKFTNVMFMKIDVDELREVAAEWKVEAMPTFVFVKGGKELARVVGADEGQLKKKIQELMN